jgi:SAM-dependent methyltransferase
MSASGDRSAAEPQTWHYGLIAKWWSEFSEDGPEIDCFRRFVERGQPALDVACGTGRLLVPFLHAGFDVDGCDVSADMIAHCRERAEREGLTPTLFVQPMHELDPPRPYRTIFVCGGFGLGSTRRQDEQALRRFHTHLQPGGTLVFDIEMPYSSGYPAKFWWKKERDAMTRSWPPDDRWDRRRGSDGADYGLQSRVVDFDPLEQRITWQMRARMWRDGELVREEEHALHINLYFKNELLMMLERAGFEEVDVRGDHEQRAPTRDDDFIVFVASKAGAHAR